MVSRRFLALLLAAACGSPSATSSDKNATQDGKAAKVSDGGVDPATAKKLAEGTKALASVGAEHRSMLAAAALAEAETTRLPAEIVAAFAEMQRVEPSTRSLESVKAIASPAVLPILEELCDGKGAATMRKVAQVAPEEKLPLLWEGCSLERAGLVTRAEAQTAGLGQMMLAHVAHRVLMGKGGASKDELTLLKAFVIDSA